MPLPPSLHQLEVVEDVREPVVPAVALVQDVLRCDVAGRSFARRITSSPTTGRQVSPTRRKYRPSLVEALAGVVEERGLDTLTRGRRVGVVLAISTSLVRCLGLLNEIARQRRQ